MKALRTRRNPLRRPRLASRILAARNLAARIDAATPAGRDRTVDALRALAIAGVILGHWLVTALVVTHSRAGAGLHDTSPLASHPALAPVSWIFQTLAVFFLVGGYSAARSYKGQYLTWLRARLVRLGRPVLVLAAVWIPVTMAMILAGVRSSTIHTIVWLVLSPLWFLGVFAGLTALTPLAVALVRRFGAAAALAPAAVVAGVDAARFGLGGPAWLGWVNVGAGWLVPYLLGIAWARGAFRGWKVPAAMLAGGAGATAALIAWAGYPASMVGVNGARISNLNPPTLAAVTFGVAQVGLALLLRPVLARIMRRPLAWAPVALANLSAMTLFLWHQSAFLAVTMAGSLIGRLPGLLTPPAGTVDRRAAGLAARLRGRAGHRVADIPPRRAVPRGPGKSRGAGRLPDARRTGGLPDADRTGGPPTLASLAGCRTARQSSRSARRLEPLQQALVLVPQRRPAGACRTW